jgi:hypothetical protein
MKEKVRECNVTHWNAQNILARQKFVVNVPCEDRLLPASSRSSDVGKARGIGGFGTESDEERVRHEQVPSANSRRRSRYY